jgi:hypothetical protein
MYKYFKEGEIRLLGKRREVQADGLQIIEIFWFGDEKKPEEKEGYNALIYKYAKPDITGYFENLATHKMSKMMKELGLGKRIKMEKKIESEAKNFKFELHFQKKRSPILAKKSI